MKARLPSGAACAAIVFAVISLVVAPGLVPQMAGEQPGVIADWIVIWTGIILLLAAPLISCSFSWRYRGLLNRACAVASLILVASAVYMLHLKWQNRSAALTEYCVMQLRNIDGCKQQWAIEHGRILDAEPSWDDLYVYIKGGGAWAKCPQGGTYEIRRVRDNPTCSIPQHQKQYEDFQANQSIEPSADNAFSLPLRSSIYMSLSSALAHAFR